MSHDVTRLLAPFSFGTGVDPTSVKICLRKLCLALLPKRRPEEARGGGVFKEAAYSGGAFEEESAGQ
jgi:hypothetical protein